MINHFPPATTPTITYEHKKIHEGRYFSGGHYNSSLADTASQDILIQVSSTSALHAIISATCGGDSTMMIYEGTTFSAAGTAVTMSNHNRASAKSFAGTVTHTPTVTATGTQINGTIFVPSGDKHTTAGASGGFTSELVLSKSTNYLVRVTNNSGAAIKASISIDGYMPDV